MLNVGVMEFDKVEPGNRDRLIGATPADAALGRAKTDVASQLMRTVTPACEPTFKFYSYSICEAKGLDIALVHNVNHLLRRPALGRHHLRAHPRPATRRGSSGNPPSLRQPHRSPRTTPHSAAPSYPARDTASPRRGLGRVPRRMGCSDARSHAGIPDGADHIRGYGSGVLQLSDLLHLARPGSEGADPERFNTECRKRGLEWPDPVLQQFLFDHGAKPEFIEQYDHLDLRQLHWSLVALPASQLLGFTCFADFGSRVQSVAAHPRWTLDQHRPGHGEVWTSTWKVPPVMIRGQLRKPPQARLHLVEGHTRLGVLRGLVRLGEVGLDSTHRVFLAGLTPSDSR